MKRLIYVLFLLVSLHCAAQDEVVFHNGTIAKGENRGDRFLIPE